MQEEKAPTVRKERRWDCLVLTSYVSDGEADARGAGSRHNHKVFTRARGSFPTSRGAVAEARDAHHGVVQSPSVLDQHRRRG